MPPNNAVSTVPGDLGVLSTKQESSLDLTESPVTDIQGDHGEKKEDSSDTGILEGVLGEGAIPDPEYLTES